MALIWFGNNYMKLNTDKCYIIVPGCKYEYVCAKIGTEKILVYINIGIINIDS